MFIFVVNETDTCCSCFPLGGQLLLLLTSGKCIFTTAITTRCLPSFDLVTKHRLYCSPQQLQISQFQCSSQKPPPYGGCVHIHGIYTYIDAVSSSENEAFNGKMKSE
jgi:hypothetical protein